MLNVRRSGCATLLVVAGLVAASPVSEQDDGSDPGAAPDVQLDLRRELRPAAMRLRGSVATTAATPLGDPIRLEPPYEVEDGLTIVTATGRVRIAGLDGPARNAICLDREEKPWACGLQARAALVNLIRGRPVTCRRTPPEPGEVASATCSVAGRDVAQALVREGFARPAGPPGQLGQPLALAQAGTQGLWDGGWSIRDGGWPIRP